MCRVPPLADAHDRLGEGLLVLADGRVFRGVAFGARATVVGEVVFNTSLTGYQEIITDPSYVGQIVCLTVAEVGNVGCNVEDLESRAHGAEALIVRSLSPAVSNWRATTTLPAFMKARGMPGLAEIDTRALTRHIRTRGAVPGALSTETVDVDRLLELARAAPSMQGRALAHEVSTREPYEWDEPSWSAPPVSRPDVDLHVVAYDFGIKHNILRCLRDEGIRTTVVPSTTSVADALALRPDGIFLSNGPGDPAALEDIVAQLSDLLVRTRDIPVFGICLGHQLVCLALGGKTYKLEFGHHGGNHPVRDEVSRRVEITAQNHGFAVVADSLGGGVHTAHVNLFDATVAGLRAKDRPLFGVQYHPEASPGPHDARHLFATFATMARECRRLRDRQDATAP
jgi:carbamoyl-phosphate synthase small subunit